MDLFVFSCFNVSLIFFSFLQLFPLKWRLVLQHASVLNLRVELCSEKIVRLSVKKLQRTVHGIILIFCMELGVDKARKVTISDFWKKIWFSRNLGKSGKKCHFWLFFQFCWKSNPGLGIQLIFEWKILWYWIFLWRSHAREKSGSPEIWEKVAKSAIFSFSRLYRKV